MIRRFLHGGVGHLHDNVTLALGELHLLLEGAAEGVEVVAAGGDLQFHMLEVCRHYVASRKSFIWKSQAKRYRKVQKAHLLGREEPEPPQASQDTGALLIILERDLRVNGRDEVLLARRRGAEHLLEDLVPGQRLLAVGLLVVLEEAEVDKDLGELGVALVTERAAGMC